MNVRKSDIAIVSKKFVKADGEKGCALYSFKNKELCRQKRADEHGEYLEYNKVVLTAEEEEDDLHCCVR